MIGKKFGRLIVIEEALPSRKYYRMWLTKCSCGTIKIVYQANLRNGTTKSCGCLRNEKSSERMRKNSSKRNTIHGLSKSSEYHAWESMKQRCYYKKGKDYKRYGGRGIQVCQRWLDSFKNFITDMGMKPSSAHSIDRIDNNKDYHPNNCKWSTIKEQNNNRRKCLCLENFTNNDLLTEIKRRNLDIISTTK